VPETAVGVAVGFAVGVGVAVGTAVGVGVEVGPRVGVGAGVGAIETTGVGVAVATADGVAEGAEDGVGVATGAPTIGEAGTPLDPEHPVTATASAVTPIEAMKRFDGRGYTNARSRKHIAI